MKPLKVLIVEDELPAATRLKKMILDADPTAEIMDVVESVEDAVAWFNTYEHPDVAFFDIQLADGISFDILKKTNVKSSVVFTTAYDYYAIKAFKVNALDYLLKPINKDELINAIKKVKESNKQEIDIKALLQNYAPKQSQAYKERFLSKIGEQLKFIPIEQTAYFMSAEGSTYLHTKDGNRFLIDDKLDTVEEQLNPKNYYRINRKLIVGIESIGKIKTHFNSRLKIELCPNCTEEVIVARERVSEFKVWLGD